MPRTIAALTALGMGAGIMYLADPRLGRRRRARAVDAGRHLSHVVRDAATTAAIDVEHRVTGAASRALESVAPAPPPSDDVLAARVRARLGRLVSHPGAIDVTASEGLIVLSGPVFDSEIGRLIDGVRAVPGVVRVENKLEPHARAGTVPGLQGRGPAQLQRRPIRWTPAARALTGAIGLLFVAFAVRRAAL
jgi:hypothetical protein